VIPRGKYGLRERRRRRLFSRRIRSKYSSPPIHINDCNVADNDYQIIIGFAGQAFISLLLAVWVFVMLQRGRLEVEHDEGTDEYENETARLSIVSKCLMAGNDLQMTQGTALVVTGLIGLKEYSLYHLRLMYDMLCFVG
jgi:hypothetical protein